MTLSLTQNEYLLRPPPGARFTIFGSDCVLEFQRGKEHEVKEWLLNWINSFDPDYVDPRIAMLMRNQRQMEETIPPPAEPPTDRSNVVPMPMRIPLPTPIKKSFFPENVEPDIIVCGATKEGKQCVLQAGHPASQEHQAPSQVPGQWVRW